ncbi:MAG TPA: hypothetical protein VFC09_09320 [Candidatus Dormibacteraeota bacterium]|nr:hypothetical protein [Candidatus Dormibacteraeota bacterium]
MKFPALPRRAPRDAQGPRDPAGRLLPDPAKVPTARGTWEEAALTNVAVTEVVKRQIRTVTRPWTK